MFDTLSESRLTTENYEEALARRLAQNEAILKANKANREEAKELAKKAKKKLNKALAELGVTL